MRSDDQKRVSLLMQPKMKVSICKREISGGLGGTQDLQKYKLHRGNPVWGALPPKRRSRSLANECGLFVMGGQKSG